MSQNTPKAVDSAEPHTLLNCKRSASYLSFSSPLQRREREPTLIDDPTLHQFGIRGGIIRGWEALEIRLRISTSR